MDALANILSIAGALGAAFYCFTLSHRLRRFTRTEDGMRGAVAALSAQVDGMTAALKFAQEAAGQPTARHDDLTRRAEEAARRLELMLAALHDIGVDDDTAAADRRVIRSRRRSPRGPDGTVGQDDESQNGKAAA